MLKAIHLYINKVSIRGQFPWYLCNTRRHYLWHSPDEAPGSIRDEMAVLMTLQALWQAETCLKDMDIGKSVKNFACKENKQLNDKSLLWNTVTISHIPACHFATSVNSNTFECIPMPVQMAVLQFASEFLDATFWRMWQTAWHCSVSRVAFFLDVSNKLPMLDYNTGYFSMRRHLCITYQTMASWKTTLSDLDPRNEVICKSNAASTSEWLKDASRMAVHMPSSTQWRECGNSRPA